MRVLFVNLKHFYQCRRLWPIYFFVGGLVWTHLHGVWSRVDALVGMTTTALCIAWIVISLEEHVASKHFCFCLPGYRNGVRKTVFFAGTLGSTLLGLWFALNMRSSYLSTDELFGVLCVGLCFAWVVYAIGSVATLLIGSNLTMVCLIWVFLLLSELEEKWPGLDCVILSHPVLLVVLGASVGVIIRLRLAHPKWFRKCCTGFVLGPLNTPDFLRNRRVSEDRRQEVDETFDSDDEMWLSPRVEEHVLGLIRKGDHRRFARCFWGMSYAHLLPWLPLSPRVTAAHVLSLLLMLLLCFAGYLGENISAFMILFVLALMARRLDDGSPLFSRMLISGGRRERFCATTISVAIFAVMSSGILVLLILVLNLLGLWLPAVSISGSTFTFHRIFPALPMLSLIVFPALGSLSFWLHGRSAAVMIPFIIPMAFPFCWGGVSAIPFSLLVAIGILSWLVFACSIWWIAMRSDLVRR